MTLVNDKDLESVLSISIQVKAQSPLSFSSFIFNNGLLDKNCDLEHTEQLAVDLEKKYCLPFEIDEMMFYSYPNHIECSNPRCERAFSKAGRIKKISNSILNFEKSPTINVSKGRSNNQAFLSP
jgi:hypothetical protein